MTYTRVTPRDLFNEASLLKSCWKNKQDSRAPAQAFNPGVEWNPHGIDDDEGTPPWEV